MTQPTYKNILTSFVESFTHLSGGLVQPSVPIVGSETVIQLCKEVQMKFKKTSSFLELKSPIVVFGDIHGHALDLVRLINEFIMNSTYKDFNFLFLGDLVDRGEFSIEVVIMIFLLIAIKPDKVFCIRGNHEFEDISRRQGFHSQIMKIYSYETGTKIFHSFIDAFDWMPLSAKIGSNILCLHGGISPFLFNVDQLKELQRPYHSFTNKLIDDILWSDPRDVDCFEKSDRGLGCFFGEKHLEAFLTINNLDLLVRAHECTSEDGYGYNGRCLTIFSASNYCGKTNNKSSVLIIRSEDEKEVRTFSPMMYLRREEVTFKRVRNIERYSSLALSTTKRMIFLPSGKSNMKGMRRSLPALLWR